MTNKISPITKRIGYFIGWAVAFCAVVLLILAVRDDYLGLRPKLKKVFFLRGIIEQREEVDIGTKEMHIQYFTPQFDDLAAVIENNAPLGEDPIQSYIVYYNYVIERFPQMADAHALTGFCYFQKGDMEKAEHYYQMASALAPAMFWHHYNLGIIYLRRGDHEKAAQAFALARKTDLATTLQNTISSAVYQQIGMAFKDRNYNLMAGLKSAYTNTDIFLQQISSGENFKDIDTQALSPRIF